MPLTTLAHSSDHHSIIFHLYQQLLNSTSLTNSFSFPLSARVSFFFMCFPKDWWLSATRRVGLFKDAWGDEAKFYPPFSLSLISPHRLVSWWQEPPSREPSDCSQAVRGHLQIRQPSPLPSSCQDDWVWRMTIRQRDKWCHRGPATHKRTKQKKRKKAGSHRYDDPLNQQRGEGLSYTLGPQSGGKRWKKFLKGKLFFCFFFYELEVKQKQKNPEWKDWMQIFARWKPQSSQNYSYLVYA